MTSFIVKEHILEGQHIRHYARATNTSHEDILKIAIKQYIPKDNISPAAGDVTIIGAHANGFPKELYEPLWDEIHARLKTNGIRIRGIWVADAAHQGASGVVNEHLLGDDPAWMDHARDLLHMVNHFKEEMSLPIVGIGHSLGASQLVMLSSLHPRLLSTMILIDPVFTYRPPTKDGPLSIRQGSNHLARMSAARRDLWSSREEAEAGFRGQRFYETWDKRVFDLWLKYGVRETPTALYPSEEAGSVTLTCTKHQEVFSFIRPIYSPYDETLDVIGTVLDNSTQKPVLYKAEPEAVFKLARSLRPSVLYVFGETSYLSAPLDQDFKMAFTGTEPGGSGGAAKRRVAKVVVEKIGHLVPMEAVQQCADASASWLVQELKRSAEAEKKYQEWLKLAKVEKMTVSESFKKSLGVKARPHVKSSI